MKTVKAAGIRSPGAAILAENILKGMESPQEGLIIELDKGEDGGFEKLAAKYGLMLEKTYDEKKTVLRMAPAGMEEVDVTGESCPGPAIIVGERIKELKTGVRIKVKSSSKDTIDDIAMVVRSMGSKAVTEGHEGDRHFIVIEKAEKCVTPSGMLNRDRVLVVQSNGIGNAERAYATFIFSKVALSMGKKVTIFTLMDGVSIVKKGNAALVKHPDFARLDKLMEEAIKMGATVYACELSAKFRGIKPADLSDGVRMAGAATYLELLSDPDNVVVNF